MADFSYIALTHEGQRASGTISAASRESAMSNLRQQNFKPLKISEIKASKGRFKFGKKVKSKDLVVFTRELATMINAGVPLPRAFETLEDQAENKYFKSIIGSINHDIENGAPIADAMAKYPDVFSDVYINMIRAGEAGGILDKIMKRLAAQVEKDAAIRHKIKSAMAYPVVILSITILAFFGIMLLIMPRISKIIIDLGGENAQLPLYTKVMIGASSFLQHNFIFIFIAFVIALILFKRYIKTDKGKYRWHLFLLKMPVLGKVVSKIAVARFSRTFASLMASGVTVLEALDVTGKAVGNRVIQAELEKVAKEVKNGQPLGKQLLQASFFPPIVGQMMSVGEETGNISEILVKVADFYEEEVDSVIDGLTSLIEPLMIVVLGALVGLIAASVMGPIAGLSKNIGG